MKQVKNMFGGGYDFTSPIKRKKIYIILTAILFLIGLFGGTYALLYETLSGDKKQVLKVADLSLILEEDENNLNITGAFPMADEVGMIQDAFTFRLINQGTTKANYQIKLVDITTGNKLSRNDVRYSLIKEGVNKIDYLTSLYKGIIDSGTITGGDEYNYEFRMWIVEEVEDNDRVAGKSLSYRIDVEVGQLEETKYIGMLQATTDSGTSTEAFWGYRSSITSVVFENTISIPNEGVVESWDVSVNKDGSVMAYIEDDGLGTDTYKLHIQGDGVVYANKDSRGLFKNFNKMTVIENLEYFNTSNASNMGSMFVGCSSLTNLDLGGFDTSNVGSMMAMFSGCSSLTSLDVSSFDTSNVTYMGDMFRDCKGLTHLDVSNFDTSKVTNMGYMFHGCSSLLNLDVSGFDTKNVTNMVYMFYNCSSLTILDVSGFNTSKVTDMGAMFRECRNLTTLNVGGFDTSNVTSLSSTFSGCSKLTKLDVSGFDTAKVTNMGAMFSNCSSLTSLDVSKFDTSNVKSMHAMFNGCSSLTKLDVHGFKTSNVTDMSNTFAGCSSLTSLDVSKFDTSNVKSMAAMFSNCTSLTEVDTSGFGTSNVTNMVEMFRNCQYVNTSLKITGNKCTSYGYMFANTSTAEGASFIVYGDGTNEELVKDMVASKNGGSHSSNVTYGGVK